MLFRAKVHTIISPLLLYFSPETSSPSSFNEISLNFATRSEFRSSRNIGNFSYGKQISRQHSCHKKNSAREGGAVDPIKFSSYLFCSPCKIWLSLVIMFWRMYREVPKIWARPLG